MSANQIISLVLLLGRIVVVVFTSMVLRLQWRLIKQNKGPDLQWYRQSLFGLSMILLIGNAVPITIDVLGIFNKGSFGLLLAYVFSNNFTAMIQAFIMWLIYHQAGKQEQE